MSPLLKKFICLAALIFMGLCGAAEVKDSVVELDSPAGWGSGSFVDVSEYGYSSNDNYIITACHVGTKADLKAVINGKRYAVTVIASDHIWDLSLLKIEGAEHRPALKLAASNAVNRDTNITIWGFPGLEYGKEKLDSSTGTVTALDFMDRKEGALGTAQAQFGDSGGPVVGDDGTMVGVTVGKALKLSQKESEPGAVIFVQIRLIRWFLDEHRVVKKAGAANVRILEFYADFCKPCQEMKPTILALRLGGLDVNTYKMEDGSTTADFEKYEVNKIPCIIVLRDGKEVERHYGVHTVEEIEGWCK